MKEKLLEICIRVSPADKKKMQRNAKKSGLNMSSYLRKCGLKQRIYKAIDENKRQIYNEIIELKNELELLDMEQIKERIVKIQSDFLDMCYAENSGDEDGND